MARATLTGHVIVCGFNALARAALAELLAAGRPTALLCEGHDDFDLAHASYGSSGVFIARGEPSQERFRDVLNAAAAEAVIVALSDDATNLIAALNVKVVNPRARLVVALHREELRQTLQAGRVTYIASPNELSGRMVASAAFEPEVALLLEDLMTGSTGEVDMQQYPVSDRMVGQTVGSLRAELIDIDGPLVVAIARQTEAGYRTVPNPKATERLERGDQILVVATDAQAERLRTEYEVTLGEKLDVP
jgi:voltage-gated potassium channel